LEVFQKPSPPGMEGGGNLKSSGVGKKERTMGAAEPKKSGHTRLVGDMDRRSGEKPRRITKGKKLNRVNQKSKGFQDRKEPKLSEHLELDETVQRKKQNRKIGPALKKRGEVNAGREMGLEQPPEKKYRKKDPKTTYTQGRVEEFGIGNVVALERHQVKGTGPDKK